MEEKKIIPTYKWVEEEGVNDITPIRRKIAKTMEVTETFTYYDALAYCMKMEKAVEDKKAEIAGLESMIKAYKDEIELIEQSLGVTKVEETWNQDLQTKLQREELDKKINEAAGEIESPYVETKEK